MVLPLNKNIPTGDNVGLGSKRMGEGGKRPGGKRLYYINDILYKYRVVNDVTKKYISLEKELF